MAMARDGFYTIVIAARDVFACVVSCGRGKPWPTLGEAYSASEEETAKLTHFCLSVLWRASLCDWPARGKVFRQLDLGPYQEQIRKYLKGDTVVPSRVSVTVLLSSLERPRLEMCFPIRYREGLHHCYRFHIPGMTFVAAVGGVDQLDISILQPPNRIFVTDRGDKAAQDGILRLFGKTPPKGFEVPLMQGIEKPWKSSDES
jgi:hypothetical protein